LLDHRGKLGSLNLLSSDLSGDIIETLVQKQKAVRVLIIKCLGIQLLLLIKVCNLVLEVYLLLLALLDASVELHAMLSLVIDLILELEHHVLDLLNSGFERVESHLCLLMLSEGLKLLIGLLILELFKLHGLQEFLVS
jgi:hypothetical protein